MTVIFKYSLSILTLFFGLTTQAQIAITNEAELRAIAENVSGHYVLENDIVLTQSWEPIGSVIPFQGILDGNGHTISNLRIDNSSLTNVGFFACTKNARIFNVGFENPQILANHPWEGVNAAVMIGKAIATTISGSYTNGGFVKSYGSAGSFIGKVSKGDKVSEITNSYSAVNVTALQMNAGGLVGNAENIHIENTYFSGLLQAKYAAGGMLGSSAGENSIISSVVMSAMLKGLYVNRIAGEKKSAPLTLNTNYARTDMLIGNLNLFTVALPESYIKGMQGENVPYKGSDFKSSYPDYTSQDIASATGAFNSAYYSSSRMLYYEYSTKIGKVAAIWTQAILFDVMLNNYLRTGDEKDLVLVNNILEGNRLKYDYYNWDNGKVWFIYDDIMWWVISLARAYEVTGEVKYLNLSKTGFERVWSGSDVLKDNGSYDPVNGGMYWAWDQKNPEGTPKPSMGKMACINYPTVIAAMTLFHLTGDSTYFHKGLEIFTWAQNNLFEKQTGRVADSKHGSGLPTWKDHVYNQATCIGAAVMLYNATSEKKYLNDAILAANYTKNQMSTNGYLDFENGIEQGIYHAIFAQYINRLIEDGRQYQYIPWLRYNINAGWANRLPDSNITYKDYKNPAPAVSGIQCYDESAIPALMQVVKPAREGEKQVNCVSRIFYEYNLNWDFGTWTISDNNSLPKLQIFSLTSGV